MLTFVRIIIIKKLHITKSFPERSQIFNYIIVGNTAATMRPTFLFRLRFQLIFVPFQFHKRIPNKLVHTEQFRHSKKRV